MDMRELKGLEIAARAKLVFQGGAWLVPSQTSGAKYRVTLSPDSCECEDFQLNQKTCKHIHASKLVQERDHGGKAPVLDTDSVPRKPTYRQNWPAYVAAQTGEKHYFRVLLHGLCQGVPEPKREGCGRRPVLLSDATFAAAYKVYSTFSVRRFMTDLREAHEKGYITQVIHPNSVSNYLENPALTPVLHSLIAQSSLPLKAIETDFAVDSSGFSTSRFVKWFDHRYGVVRQSHDWVKVHLMAGVRTHVVTAVEIQNRDANDSPLLPPLVEATARNFVVRKVCGDKGYSSVENLETVAAMGAKPYIPFKANATGGAGGLWEKLFLYYSLHREDFLAAYHARSNVESVFSMIKAKFRDHVRSRTDTAMRNEALCKILCHNVCVLIQSMHELGIEPHFWAGSALAQKFAL
jgi:transposase